MQKTPIERELQLRLVLSEGRSVQVPARLTYCPDDPYAVHAAFHIGSGAPVHWTFARDLLIDGVERPSGCGDVRLWPAGGGAYVFLSLASPDGEALMEAPAALVRAWLDETLRAVPSGSEADGPALEEALGALLAPGDGMPR